MNAKQLFDSLDDSKRQDMAGQLIRNNVVEEIFLSSQQ